VKDQILHLGFLGKVAIQSAPVSYLSKVKSILHFKPTVLMNRHVFCMLQIWRGWKLLTYTQGK